MRILRNILRINQIIVTLIRYGFGGVVAELGVLPYLSFLNWFFIFRRKGRGLTVPERIRKVLEELGPTFVKLGQVASTRADLLPGEWINEFKKLQDMVPPVPFEDIKRVVERSLNAPLSRKFAFFEQTPIASASIAQVYYAKLHDGTEVAVKVKRPDIEKTISSDISVMYTVAGLLTRHIPASRHFRPIEVVDEFSRVLTTELDLSVEGSNASLFLRLFKDEPFVKIPKVYWDYTSSEVLTMERVEATPLDEADKIISKGLDIKAIAVEGVRMFFKQVFDFGVFHADLHPGNICVTDDGRLVYFDFGIVGRLDRELKNYLASMLFYLIRQDYHRMAVVHREMGLIGKDVDISEFEHALRDVTEPVFGKTLEEISIAALLLRLIHTARRFKITLQPNLLLLQKSMVIMEGVGRQLYADVNMWEVAKPLVYKWIMKQKLSPGAYFEKGREFTEELTMTAFDLPRQFHTLLSAALKDDLKIGFVHHRLEGLSDGILSAGRRIASGLIAGALFIGSSILAVLPPQDGAKFLGLPAISAAGFIIAAAVWIKLMFGAKNKNDTEF